MTETPFLPPAPPPLPLPLPLPLPPPAPPPPLLLSWLDRELVDHVGDEDVNDDGVRFDSARFRVGAKLHPPIQFNLISISIF